MLHDVHRCRLATEAAAEAAGAAGSPEADFVGAKQADLEVAVCHHTQPVAVCRPGEQPQPERAFHAC